jgi:hypothetical protein
MEPTDGSNWKAKIESFFNERSADFLRGFDIKVNNEYWPDFLSDSDTDLSWPVWLEIEWDDDELS